MEEEGGMERRLLPPFRCHRCLPPRRAALQISVSPWIPLNLPITEAKPRHESEEFRHDLAFFIPFLHARSFFLEKFSRIIGNLQSPLLTSDCLSHKGGSLLKTQPHGARAKGRGSTGSMWMFLLVTGPTLPASMMFWCSTPGTGNSPRHVLVRINSINFFLQPNPCCSGATDFHWAFSKLAAPIFYIYIYFHRTWILRLTLHFHCGCVNKVRYQEMDFLSSVVDFGNHYWEIIRQIIGRVDEIAGLRGMYER